MFALWVVTHLRAALSVSLLSGCVMVKKLLLCTIIGLIPPLVLYFALTYKSDDLIASVESALPTVPEEIENDLEPKPEPKPSRITLDNYWKIKNGNWTGEVYLLLGIPSETSSMTVGNTDFTTWVWRSNSGGYIKVTFRNSYFQSKTYRSPLD